MNVAVLERRARPKHRLNRVTATRRHAGQHRTRARPGSPARQASKPGTTRPQAGHDATASRATADSHQAGAAADAGASGTASAHRPAPSADWRDQIIAGARQPWQPGPGWPCNPAVPRPPEPQAQQPGLEPDA